jgi:hypothetical protein
MYKIKFGLVDVIAADLFNIVDSGNNTRGHQYIMSYNHCCVDSCKYFFAERVVKPWNSSIGQPSDFSGFNNCRCFIMKSDFSVFTFI